MKKYLAFNCYMKRKETCLNLVTLLPTLSYLLFLRETNSYFSSFLFLRNDSNLLIIASTRGEGRVSNLHFSLFTGIRISFLLFFSLLLVVHGPMNHHVIFLILIYSQPHHLPIWRNYDVQE